jgi:hypothetical protein
MPRRKKNLPLTKDSISFFQVTRLDPSERQQSKHVKVGDWNDLSFGMGLLPVLKEAASLPQFFLLNPPSNQSPIDIVLSLHNSGVMRLQKPPQNRIRPF